jgi:hypothetical protein
MKLGTALFILGAAPALAVMLAAVQDDWSWMALAGVGPIAPGVYLICVNPPMVFDEDAK